MSTQVTLYGFSCAVPSSGPTAAVGTVSGSLNTSASYNYKVTYVTGFGETTGSALGNVTTNSTGSVNLSAIPVSPNTNVTARILYRTVGGGSTYLLLDTIANNTATTYTDIIADGSLGAAIPTLNTAGSLTSIEGTCKTSGIPVRTIERAITAGAGGTSLAAYQLSNEYNWVSTVATTNDSVKLPCMATNLIGSHIVIRNNGANTMRVYPFNGQSINGGGADSPVTVAAGVSTQLVSDLATNWAQI